MSALNRAERKVNNFNFGGTQRNAWMNRLVSRLTFRMITRTRRRLTHRHLRSILTSITPVGALRDLTMTRGMGTLGISHTLDLLRC